MHWKDEGYLLSKNSFDENSIIMEAFTLDHGKCSGIVYGGNSRKNKKIFTERKHRRKQTIIIWSNHYSNYMGIKWFI